MFVAVILLINPKEDRRRFILAAFDLGMCDGEFVFYTLDMLPDQNITNSDQIWKGSDERDDDARKAFESVFHVSVLHTGKGLTLPNNEDLKFHHLDILICYTTTTTPSPYHYVTTSSS